MPDLYFNELSVDHSYSSQPSDKNKVKELILQFIETYFTYKICCGEESIYILSMTPHSILKISHHLGGDKFKDLLDELEEDNKINEIQKMLFKSAINEAFSPEWNSEYHYDKENIDCIGPSCTLDIYAISYMTNIQGTTQDWNLTHLNVNKTTLNPDETINTIQLIAKHLSSIKHVVIEHKIWENCVFINKGTSKSLLPNKVLSEYIVKAFTDRTWLSYYQNEQHIAVTMKVKIGSAIARINGWTACRVKDERKVFNVGNKYLAIDTQHSTFEYYSGTSNHQGEITFSDDTINRRKAKKTRNVNLA